MKINLNTYYKHQLIVGFLLGFWLVVFLILIGPFDAATLPTSIRFKIMYGYGFVFFVCYAMVIPFQNWFFRKKKTWTLSFELISVLGFFLISIIPTYLYYKTDIVNGDFSFNQFVFSIYIPTSIVVLPLVFFGRWMITKFKPKNGWLSKDFNSKDDLDYTSWKKRIDQLMDKEIFLNPNITQQEMASQLNTNSSVLSKVINTGYGLNFNDFINKNRIDLLVEKIKNGRHKSHTLSGVSSECGFNSKATFNRAFKKHMKMSPREYIKSLESE